MSTGTGRGLDPDADLAEADASVRSASASLIALEGHGGYLVLQTWPLRGVSATRWEEVKATLAELHADFERYRDVVARARAARGTRTRPTEAERAAVAEVLHGESVSLAEEEIPLQRRGLLGPAAVPHRIRPAVLLDRMSAAFDAVTEVVGAVDTVRDAVAARLDPVDAALDDVTQRASALGAPADGVDGWRTDIGTLRREALADPLALDPANPLGTDGDARVAAVAEGVADLRARLDELAALRADLPARVRELDAALEDLVAMEDAALDAAARVARTIDTTGTRLPSPERVAVPLRARRRDAEAAAAQGRWSQARDAFARLADDVARARARAETDRDVLVGLLDRRAELRGRLGALVAKATARGRSEDLALDALRREAHDLLWSAPCNLAAATVAVRRYQRALAEPDPERPGTPPRGES